MKDGSNDAVHLVFQIFIVILGHAVLKAFVQDKLQRLPTAPVPEKDLVVPFGNVEIEALAPVAAVYGYSHGQAAILLKDAQFPTLTE